jgi:hypothetical protein
VNELRSDGSAIDADDGQAVAFCAEGILVARHQTAVFCDELCDSHLFIRGQFFDLLNDLNRTHGLIIRQNVFLASRIALRSCIQNDFGNGVNPLMQDHQARPSFPGSP